MQAGPAAHLLHGLPSRWTGISTQSMLEWCRRDTSANQARELSAEALALQERVDALGIAVAERIEENNGLQEQVTIVFHRRTRVLWGHRAKLGYC